MRLCRKSDIINSRKMRSFTAGGPYEDASGIPFQASGLMKSLQPCFLWVFFQVPLMFCHQYSQAAALFMMVKGLLKKNISAS